VYKTFSKKVTHAVVGIGAGPKKMQQCEEMGVTVIDEDKLFLMISSYAKFGLFTY
jgi:BRCT domain type II-containing protein